MVGGQPPDSDGPSGPSFRNLAALGGCAWPATESRPPRRLHARQGARHRPRSPHWSAARTSPATGPGTRNLECGLLIRGGPVPALLADHLLTAEGIVDESNAATARALPGAQSPFSSGGQRRDGVGACGCSSRLRLGGTRLAGGAEDRDRGCHRGVHAAAAPPGVPRLLCLGEPATYPVDGNRRRHLVMDRYAGPKRPAVTSPLVVNRV